VNFVLLIKGIVALPLGGVLKSFVGVGERYKVGVIARFRIVRMVPRGQHPVDTLNSFQLRVGADLEQLIVIDEIGIRRHFCFIIAPHGYSRLSTSAPLELALLRPTLADHLTWNVAE